MRRTRPCEPLVHRLDAEHDDAAYRGQHGRSPGVETEVYRAYERTHHVYLVVVDINSYVLASGYAGIAWGRKYGGMAEVPATFDFVTVVHGVGARVRVGLARFPRTMRTSCRMAPHCAPAVVVFVRVISR